MGLYFHTFIPRMKDHLSYKTTFCGPMCLFSSKRTHWLADISTLSLQVFYLILCTMNHGFHFFSILCCPLLLIIAVITIFWHSECITETNTIYFPCITNVCAKINVLTAAIEANIWILPDTELSHMIHLDTLSTHTINTSLGVA